MFTSLTDSNKIKDILLDPATHVITLLALILDHYGTDCLNWEADSLKLSLESEYGLTLGSFTVDKLQAGIATLTSDAYNRSFENFNVICNAFNLRFISFETLDPPNPQEIAWFFVCLKLLIANDFDSRTLNPEILKYLEIIFQSNSIYSPIEGLEFIKTSSPVLDEDVDVDFRETVYQRELQEKTLIY